MGRLRRLSRERALIVGSGRAGVAAAEELRRSGFEDEVVVLSADAELPYHRPSCSKGVLTGRQRPADIGLPLRDCVDVRWEFGKRAAFLDPVSRIVETTDNQRYHYDGLIIASGGRAAPPPNMQVGPGLHVLHQLSDAWKLRQDLRRAHRVAIVGAGLTGCEAASAVWSMARECVIIDSHRHVMSRALGGVAGKLINREMRRNGVRMLMGRRVVEIDRRRNGEIRLWLNDESHVDVDVVVVTTGERPETSWLADAPGLDTSDGVLCDASLRVVGADGIAAAGDVARWPNLRDSPTPKRCGQWITALVQGRAAAQAILAGDDPLPPVAPLTRLFSEQFGLRIQVSGDLDENAQVHLTPMRPRRRDIARAGMLVSYVKEDRVVGLVAVNAPRAFIALTRVLLLAPRPAPMTRSGRLNLAAVEEAGIEAPQVMSRPASPARRPETAWDRVDRADRADRADLANRGDRGGSRYRVESVHLEPAHQEPTQFEPARHERAHPGRIYRSGPDPDNGRIRAVPMANRPERRPAPERHGPPESDTPTPVREMDIIWRASGIHPARSHHAQREPEPAHRAHTSEPDVIWRASGIHPARSHHARREPEPAHRAHASERDAARRASGVHAASGRRAHQEPDPEPDDWYEVEQAQAAEASRPTISSHRQEPENWVYS